MISRFPIWIASFILWVTIRAVRFCSVTISLVRSSTFLAVCGKEAVSKGVKAGDIIKNVTAICGGKGGGKPDSAMGGGNDLLKLDDALAKVDDLVAEKLGL